MVRRLPSLVGALIGSVCVANGCQVDSGYSYGTGGSSHSGGKSSGSGGTRQSGGTGGEGGSNAEAGSGDLGGNAGAGGEGVNRGGADVGSSGAPAGAAGASGASAGGSAGMGPGGAGGEGAVVGAAGAGGEGGSGGSTIDCGAKTVCGSVCAVLASDNAHCGACGHDCGAGASCVAGECLPASLTATPQDVRGGVGVDTTGIYFGDGTKIVTCPLNGCTLAPKQILSATYVKQIDAGQGNLAWVGLTDVGRTAINKCASASCMASMVASGDAITLVELPEIAGKSLFFHRNANGVPAYVADHIECSPLATGGCAGMTSYVGKAPFTTDGSSLAYFPTQMNAPTTFVACPISAATCAPVGLAPTAGVTALAAAQGTLYLAWSGLVGPNPTRLIQTCSLTAGCTAATKLTNTSASETVVDVVADSSGVYWAYGGDAGSIWMCPAGGCVGGARRIAASQANPFSLRLHGNFVYWGAQGLAMDPLAAGSFGLRRVAKPVIQ